MTNNALTTNSRLRQAKVFIGTRDCGCLIAISVDYDASLFSEWKSYGYKIETTTLEDARNRLKECTHND